MLTKCNVFCFGKYNITFCTVSSNEAVILQCCIAKPVIKGNLKSDSHLPKKKKNFLFASMIALQK